MPVLYILLLLMSRLNKTELAIFISLIWSLLPKDLTYQNLFLEKTSLKRVDPDPEHWNTGTWAIKENKRRNISGSLTR